MAPSTDRTLWIAKHITPVEPALRAWVRSRLAPGIDADDIIQETYAVLASLPGVEHIHSPRAYAFQAAQSLIRRHSRRARIIRFEAIDDVDMSVTAMDEPSPERQVAARQDMRRLSDLVDALPSRRREAFVLRRIEGLSQRDVAVRMGISESTVEKHLLNAQRALLEGMGRNDPGG
jgi:RNA polymerase sigma-70 factor (ECF subfamily)